MSVNETLVEEKMHTLQGEYAQLSFNKCPIYTHDDASAKLSTNSHETENSVYMADFSEPHYFKNVLYIRE